MVNLKTFSASLDVDLVVGNILIRVLYSWQISTSLINKRFLRDDIFVVKFHVNCVTSNAWNTFNAKSISYITAYEIVNNVILINLANGYNTKRNVIVFINIYCWICKNISVRCIATCQPIMVSLCGNLRYFTWHLILEKYFCNREWRRRIVLVHTCCCVFQ